MIGRVQHLEEERLFDCYLAERAGDAADPRLAVHLADCPECTDRYTDLVRFMETLDAQGEAEADAIFTPACLRNQREQIARRVEQTGTAARVISFPGRFVQRHISGANGRIAVRWTASAAAAGLVVGVGLGMILDQQRALAPAASVTARSSAPVAAAPAPDAPRPLVSDYDTFVRELDQARGGPGSPELRMFDELTPHVHEISMPLH